MKEQQENRDGVDLDELEEKEDIEEDVDDNTEAPMSWSEIDQIARQLNKIIYHR